MRERKMMETSEFIKLFKQLDEHRIEVYGEHGEKLLKQYLDTNTTPAEITALQQENTELKKALELACEEIASFRGTCPHETYDDITICKVEECENKYAECWKLYFMQQAKEANDGNI